MRITFTSTPRRPLINASLADAVPPLDSTNTRLKPSAGNTVPAGVGLLGASNPAAVDSNLAGSMMLLLIGSRSVYLSLNVSSSKTLPSDITPATMYASSAAIVR